jgi:hypothetical protein
MHHARGLSRCRSGIAYTTDKCRRYPRAGQVVEGHQVADKSLPETGTSVSIPRNTYYRSTARSSSKSKTWHVLGRVLIIVSKSG